MQLDVLQTIRAINFLVVIVREGNKVLHSTTARYVKKRGRIKYFRGYLCLNADFVILHHMEVVHIVHMENMNIFVIQIIVPSVALHLMVLALIAHLENICMEVMVVDVSSVVQHQLVLVLIAHMENMSVNKKTRNVLIVFS